MTPAARLQAAIDILDTATAQPADRFLRDWFRARRYAGSKDRAAVAERVYDVLRHRSSYAWRMGAGARAWVIASLLEEGASGEAIADLFSGQGYGPAPLDEDERARLVAPPTDDPPPHVIGEYPPFLEEELCRAFQSFPVIPGERPEGRETRDPPGSFSMGPGSRSADALLGRDDNRLLSEMRALQSRAPIDLRANTLKTTRDELLAALKHEDFDAVPARYSPFAIRVTAGAKGLERTTAFAGGLFEFQDEASQIAALLCGARAGMRVLDLAAGAGGKTLALAAAMDNRGEIVARDENPDRLKPLADRAARAGAGNIRILPLPPRNGGEGRFDVVLIDAPCSGTGTWRRQPELRWRITPEKLTALTQIQDGMLEDGARCTRGRLVYVTCSLLPCENEDRIAQFLKSHADFTILPAADAWHQAAATPPPPGMARFFRASPHTTGTDGFFTAVLQRDR